jgi:PAS domain S-box-containing protein
MVVDDSPEVRKQLDQMLKPHNYTLVFAKSGREFFILTAENPADLIILNLELPDMNGMAILERLRDDVETRDIPVLVISGNPDANLFGKVLKGGAQDFIKKPFSFEEIILKVGLWIEYIHKNYENIRSQKLLQEYKDAVDRSSIVSKTDTKGHITFANEAFCAISGFSEEELLGQPHNIIRHPDMPKSAFESMWKTIQSKRSWKGIVKNRKKNGDFYYVDTVISPILDARGKISEYIAIRKDITDIESVKESLRNELSLENLSFQDALQLSQEYKRAIDSSSILSRTDTRGNILYANEAFYELSGYTPGEIIGKTHAITRHPDNPKSLFRDIWKTIQNGEVWKGTLMNRAKSGAVYYVKTVIFPIKNAKDEIIEYMAIRSNVTDIIYLHREIEETQREVIYKMGEIGESRSKETGNHVKRVAEYSYLLAKAYGLPDTEAELIKNASPMHDIGKVAIPDTILNKPARFSNEEFSHMKKHAMIGYNVLNGSNRSLLQAAAIVAHQHHERWDGTGYPQGLKGEAIHIYGRITAIADVFDALGSDRVYKKAWELDRILELFHEERGRHFDPMLIDKFFLHLEDFLNVRERYKDQ